MLLTNYDFYDLHAVLIMIRSKPSERCNADITHAVQEVLGALQRDNIIDDNIIRKKLRTLKTVDEEYFRWIYVDNIYTYGEKVVKDTDAYSLLEKGFEKMHRLAVDEDYKQLEILADAFHNVPIFFANGCKNIKKALKTEFSNYSKLYNTDLLKELSD